MTGFTGGVVSVRLMPRTPEPDVAEVIAFRDAAEFEDWLADHVDESAGVWLKIAKKGSGIASLTDDEAVDIGLCYGWISGQRKSFDEEHYLQKYVPRRPKSRWSQVNVRKVAELTAQGRMRPSGLAEVEAAKADGRWDAAYESQREATGRSCRSPGGEPTRSYRVCIAQQDQPICRDSGRSDSPRSKDSGGPYQQGHC